MKRFYLLIIFYLVASINLHSQAGTIKIAKPTPKDTLSIAKAKLIVSVLCGYLWQGYNNAELGIIPIYYLKPGAGNISLTLGCNFFNHYVTYITPFANLKYAIPIRIGGGAGTLALNYSLPKVNGITDQRITPEIGYDWNGNVNISYGYNIPIAGGQIPFISPHRITIRWWHLNLLPR